MRARFYLLLIPLVLSACGGDEGDGLSDVGDQADLPPVVTATVVGAGAPVSGADHSMRSGSTVLLTSVEFTAQDSAIVEAEWSIENVSPPLADNQSRR